MVFIIFLWILGYKFWDYGFLGNDFHDYRFLVYEFLGYGFWDYESLDSFFEIGGF